MDGHWSTSTKKSNTFLLNLFKKINILNKKKVNKWFVDYFPYHKMNKTWQNVGIKHKIKIISCYLIMINI